MHLGRRVRVGLETECALPLPVLDLGRMTRRLSEANGRTTVRDDREGRDAVALCTPTPPPVHRLSPRCSQLVHRHVKTSDGEIRELERAVARPPIGTDDSRRTRRLSCFRPFRSIDRKLELHSYFD